MLLQRQSLFPKTFFTNSFLALRFTLHVVIQFCSCNLCYFHVTGRYLFFKVFCNKFEAQSGTIAISGTIKLGHTASDCIASFDYEHHLRYLTRFLSCYILHTT